MNEAWTARWMIQKQAQQSERHAIVLDSKASRDKHVISHNVNLQT